MVQSVLRLLRSFTCALKGFFLLLSHVIYLKSWQENYKSVFFPKLQFLNDKLQLYTQKNYVPLGNLAKFMFWSISSFKNLQAWKVYSFLSFSGERYIWENWKYSFCRKFRLQLLRDSKKSSPTNHSVWKRRNSYNPFVSLR